MRVGREGGCEGREKLPVPRREVLALQTGGTDSRAFPPGPGDRGHGGVGAAPPRAYLPGESGWPGELSMGPGESRGVGDPGGQEK